MVAAPPFLAYTLFVVVGVALSASFPGPLATTTFPTAMLTTILAGVLGGLAVETIALGAMFVAAHEAVERRPVDLLDTVSRGSRYFVSIILLCLSFVGVAAGVELIILFLTNAAGGALGLVLGFVLFPLWACALLVAGFFLTYALPAVVLSDLSPTRAIAESYGLAAANAGRTVVVGLVLFVVNIGATLISYAFTWIPVLGLILLPLAIDSLAAAFSAVLLTTVYLDLTGRQTGVLSADPLA